MGNELIAPVNVAITPAQVAQTPLPSVSCRRCAAGEGVFDDLTFMSSRSGAAAT